jgi:hypothetical protein
MRTQAEKDRRPEYDVMVTNPRYRYTICGGKLYPKYNGHEI